MVGHVPNIASDLPHSGKICDARLMKVFAQRIFASSDLEPFLDPRNHVRYGAGKTTFFPSRPRKNRSLNTNREFPNGNSRLNSMATNSICSMQVPNG